MDLCHQVILGIRLDQEDPGGEGRGGEGRGGGEAESTMIG